MTHHFALAMCLALTIPATVARAAPPSPPERPRLIVLTDIRAGLVASSNLGHGQRVRPELIRRVGDACQNVRPDLLLHDPRPRPALA